MIVIKLWEAHKKFYLYFPNVFTHARALQKCRKYKANYDRHRHRWYQHTDRLTDWLIHDIDAISLSMCEALQKSICLFYFDRQTLRFTPDSLLMLLLSDGTFNLDDSDDFLSSLTLFASGLTVKALLTAVDWVPSSRLLAFLSVIEALDAGKLNEIGLASSSRWNATGSS